MIRISARGTETERENLGASLRRAASTMDSDVRVINVSTDTVHLESDPEVIELDNSSDAVAISCSPLGTKNTARVSSPDVIETPVRSERRNPQLAPKPLFKVMFRDECASRQYRQQIKNFLQALVQTRSLKKDTNESSLTLEIWDDEVESKDEEMIVDTGNENVLNDDVQCDDFLFTIDKRPNIKDDLDIPTYNGQKYENTFEASNHETQKDFMPKLNCFNCNGNHNLRDCPLPKNQSNINKNRKEFATKHGSNNVRYHMSEDQRFSHMVPGQLSQKLRKALGLKNNELPKHVYRMRLLGYPPGWLEEARLQHSGLSLFNSDGLAESDTNKEEGEIITDENRDQYDIKKIYDFPGFNVLPPPGTADDSHKYWVPQMQIIHSKRIMLMNLQGKEADDGYKRKKLKLPPVVNNVNNETVETVSDMEIEDTEENVVESVPFNGHFVPPLPKESVQVPPPPPLSDLSQITDDSDSQSQELPSFDSAYDITSVTNSPSLSELERTKKVLLMEIEETNSNSNSISTKNDTAFVSETPFSSFTTTPSTSRRSSIQESVKSELPSSLDISIKTELNTSLDTSIFDKTPESNSTPVHSTSQKSSDQASVKLVHFGTPILPSTSPYNKLPSSEKFSKDICDVINFENLPDSTGKYKQMTGVLQKVRRTMERLHQQE